MIVENTGKPIGSASLIQQSRLHYFSLQYYGALFDGPSGIGKGIVSDITCLTCRRS